MKLLRSLLIPLALVISFSASAFTVYNDLTDDPIHFRVHGPKTANYYGKVKAGESVTRNVSSNHIKLYVYFRTAYDWLFPFTPGGNTFLGLSPGRDIICPELKDGGVNSKADIHVVENNGIYQCKVTLPS